MELRVTAMRYEAEGILSVELRDLNGAMLPPFDAGSHIDLCLPNGITRSYSLAGDPSDNSRYLVGVGLDAKSRGGSRFVHERLRVGQMLKIDGPRNNFPLVPSDAPVVLIAGGIGITPMMAMLKQLAHLSDRAVHIYYAMRDPSRAAFVNEIAQLTPNLTLHYDSEAGSPFNMVQCIAAHPDAHFYCCGPGPMLDAYEQATAHLPEEQVHLEYFSPKIVDGLAPETGFTVEARKSGISVDVNAGQSIAQALESVGIAVQLSCAEGVCGTCETRILSGEADHRDSVLSKSEREANRTMMVCVSRCRGDHLVLDI